MTDTANLFPHARRDQQRAAATLAVLLLREDLPACYWVLSSTGGQAKGGADSQSEVQAWADVISGGRTEIRRYPNGAGSLLAVGADLEVWCRLTEADLASLAEVHPGQTEIPAGGETR